MHGHDCNAYCDPIAGEHCELVLTPSTTEDHARQQIAAAYWHRLGAKVSRVEMAPEAPDLSMIPLDRQQEIGAGGPSSDAMRWLVWWT